MPCSEQAPIEMDMDEKPVADNSEMVEEKGREKEERRKGDGRQKDCFAFSSSGGGDAVGSCGKSEAEQQDRQRQIDQWDLKQPGVMEPHPEVEKRQRNA